jgi:hypothetical protein
MFINKKLSLLCGLALLASAGAEAQWNKPTPAPLQSQVQPQLNVDIAKDTEVVHFINTNNDPFVFTKVYVLKHADPYEIRPYVMSAIRSRRVDSNDSKVEAIKFMDGTGMLIISAEEYRFSDVPNGMSIDNIVATLDQPQLSSTAGRQFYLYFPKYFDSITLASIVRNVGLMKTGDAVELGGGGELVAADTGLNAMLFYTTPASVKHIESILGEYDGPTTEAIVTYTIYELSYENDGNIGVDFQAWKNGPGSDLFAAASRYSSGWDFVNNTVARSTVKSSHTNFINFNPKWNSKYLDFLVSKSKAKVVTSGSLSVMNNCAAKITSKVSLPIIEDGDDIAQTTLIAEYVRASSFTGWTLSAISQDRGQAITITNGVNSNYAGEMVAARTKVGSNYFYTLKIEGGTGYYFSCDGKNLGLECRAFDVELTDNAGATPAWQTDQSYAIQKDKARKTVISDYGFEMSITPQICDLASTVDIDMTNTSLIGFQSTGAPRTSRTSLKTKVMVDNAGGMFYIGGLDKRGLVRSVSKVPFLGDIPGLGWIFSAESEVVKKSQIVAVLEIKPVAPDTKVSEKYEKQAADVNNTVNNFGVKTKIFDENEYGFDQYLLDKDK